MKAIRITLAILALSLLLCGCGKVEKQDTVSMYDLRKAMLEADPTLPDMLSVSDSDEDADKLFSYLSDLSYDKVDAFFLSYSSEGKADEIAVIAVKDSKHIDEAVKSLEAQVQERKNLYQSYDPSQLERVEKAKVFSAKQYAVLIISDQAEDVKKAFESFIENSGK